MFACAKNSLLTWIGYVAYRTSYFCISQYSGGSGEWHWLFGRAFRWANRFSDLNSAYFLGDIALFGCALSLSWHRSNASAANDLLHSRDILFRRINYDLFSIARIFLHHGFWLDATDTSMRYFGGINASAALGDAALNSEGNTLRQCRRILAEVKG